MAVICNNLVMPSSEYYQMKAFVEGNDCKLHANFNSAGINQYGNNLCGPDVMMLKLIPWSSGSMGIRHLF